MPRARAIHPPTLRTSTRSVALQLVVGVAVAMIPGSGGSEPPSDSAARLERALARKALAVEDEDLAAVLVELESLASADVGTATAILASLEAADARLRLGRYEGVATLLDRLESEWADSPSISSRTRSLHALLQMRQSRPIEPNGVEGVAIGRAAGDRYRPTRDAASALMEIPGTHPILCMSLLQDSHRQSASEAFPRLVVGFVDRDAFHGEGPQQTRLREAVSLAQSTAGEGVLVALCVFLGNQPAPELAMDAEPWRRLVVIWIRGTFEQLEGVQRRTRYEWLPGASFLRIAPGGDLEDWCLPWDTWRSFVARLSADR